MKKEKILQPNGKTKYPGVRVRGNSIQIDFRYKRKRCRETLRMKPTEKNVLKVFKRLCLIHEEISLSKFNYADHFPNSNNAVIFGGGPKTNLTVSETIDWWWTDFKKNVGDSSIKKYESDIKNHIKPGIGHILLNDITPRKIRYWLDNKELANSSKSNIIILIRGSFLEAYSEGVLKSPLHDKLPNYKRSKKIKHPFTIHEVDALLSNLSSPLKEFYKFSIWTGLSTGEQLSLQWQDIDFEKCTLNISRQLAGGVILKNTKNTYRERVIELLHPAHATLLKLKPTNYDEDPSLYKEEWIFTNPRTNDHWRLEAITLPWKKACKELNIEYRKPYETRHTFASIMVTACLPDGWIRRQMGHSSMKMLAERYGKFFDNAAEVTEWLKKKTSKGKNGKQFEEFFFK